MLIPVTALGYVGDLLILQTTFGLMAWPDPAPGSHEPGASGHLRIERATAAADATDTLYRSVEQRGQLARLTDGTGSDALLLLPPRLELPKFVALTLQLPTVELNEGVEPPPPNESGSSPGCPCVTPEEIRAACGFECP